MGGEPGGWENSFLILFFSFVSPLRAQRMGEAHIRAEEERKNPPYVENHVYFLFLFL